ncbi:protein hugin [Haematobia irritans]|uniref:protein hugin n=1 Tax=Haematobia irritans TaxID=7368 RepID=UPI003F50718A
MTGLSFLTFVLVGFCCYTLSSSNPTRTEVPTKNLDLPPQQQQQTSQQNAHTPLHASISNDAKTETRRKRSQLDLGSASGVFGAGGVTEYKDFGEFLEDLGDNGLLASSLMPQSQEVIDAENISPLVYFMLLQKIKQVQNGEWQAPTRRTPRLGRSIDFQLFDTPAVSNGAMASALSPRDFENSNALANEYTGGMAHQYLPRVMKKSVQFKPRLGKRTQVCD